MQSEKKLSTSINDCDITPERDNCDNLSTFSKGGTASSVVTLHPLSGYKSCNAEDDQKIANDVMDSWRDSFYTETFGDDYDKPLFHVRDSQNKSKNFSQKDIVDTIDLLENFSTNLKYRKMKHNGYSLRQKYIIREAQVPGEVGIKKHLVCINDDGNNKGHNKIVCAIEDIFDAIYSAHMKVGHKKVAATKNKADEIYCNITKSMVKNFINLCPVCAQVSEKTKNRRKGPDIAIKSVGFHDCIQVDLIDYQTDP